MIYAEPSDTFTAVLENAATGLTGTLGVRIENANGTNHTARVTAGIVELEANSGSYAKANLVAPSTAGTYIVLWDTGGGTPSFAAEELVVTTDLPVPASPLPTDRDMVRLMIGDTDVDDPLLSDDEIASFLARQVVEGDTDPAYNIPAAAADAASAIAGKFARDFDFSEDGQNFARAQRVGHYVSLERELRNRAGAYTVSMRGTITT